MTKKAFQTLDQHGVYTGVKDSLALVFEAARWAVWAWENGQVVEVGTKNFAGFVVSAPIAPFAGPGRYLVVLIEGNAE